jgi:hypothetical protein
MRFDTMFFIAGVKYPLGSFKDLSIFIYQTSGSNFVLYYVMMVQ